MRRERYLYIIYPKIHVHTVDIYASSHVLLLAMIIAETRRINEMVTKKVMAAEAIATGTTMLYRSIGIFVAGE